MKKRGISIAAFAIAGVFIATAIVFSICVYSDYNSGLKAAGAKFEKLSSRTAEASEIYPSGSKEFINLFNSAVGAPEIYESINLKINGKDVYVYPMESDRSASAFVKTFSTRIVGGDGADIRLDANIHTVSSSLIYYRAKIAFIVILAGTLLCCILLLTLYLGETVQEDEVEFKKTKVEDEFGESLMDEEESESYTDDQAAQTEEESAPQNEMQAQEKTEAPKEAAPSEPEQKQEEKVDYNPLENAYADQKAQDQDIQKPVDSAPLPLPGSEQGLFSPASGFGWESYLNTRLESELVRAASSEQDLALAIIKIPGMTKESDYYGNVCQTLQNFFQFKDFIFECKDDGFAAIMQHSDVDTAMQNAEVLHSDIVSALKAAGQSAKPLIGISSRSLRLISAERLKNEAEQALVHAADDPNSPIIAFRVNPEKYRKYIGGQSEEEEAPKEA
ncbi:MAG: hypothetical protein IK015_12560 [Treponema sp.]|nr:hypothetical protein [Treponema sp.]